MTEDDAYRSAVLKTIDVWKTRIQKEPYYSTQLARRFQKRVNRMIPERVHVAITSAVKHMTEGVCLGIGYTSGDPARGASLAETEKSVDNRISFYAKAAAAEGALTGAGGLLLGLADFPLWLTVKMKMLFEIAALYGHDATDFRERIFLLHIFELTFSGFDRQRQLLEIIVDWNEQKKRLPATIGEYDWRSFQQEYRDTLMSRSYCSSYPVLGPPSVRW